MSRSAETLPKLSPREPKPSPTEGMESDQKASETAAALPASSHTPEAENRAGEAPRFAPEAAPDARGFVVPGVLWASSDASPAELARRQRVVDAIAKAAARKPSSRRGRR